MDQSNVQKIKDQEAASLPLSYDIYIYTYKGYSQPRYQLAFPIKQNIILHTSLFLLIIRRLQQWGRGDLTPSSPCEGDSQCH